MPHDKKGELLQEGDIVYVRFEVTGVYGGEAACNVSLKAADEVEGEYPPLLTTNSKFVEKVDRLPVG